MKIKRKMTVGLFVLMAGFLAHTFSPAKRPVAPPVPSVGAPGIPSVKAGAAHDPDRLSGLWRWRHGYFRSGEEWFWLCLGDEARAMSKADGDFFDSYIKGLLSFWKTNGRMPQGGEGMSGKIIFKKTPDTPSGAGRVTCFYDAWGSTVVVRFNMENGEGGVVRPVGRVRWTYSRSSWRRARGYHRNLLGAYRFDVSYPRHWGAAEGHRLDALMDHGIDYWTDVVVMLALERLKERGWVEGQLIPLVGRS